MILTEQHIIKKANVNFKQIDHLCFLSKNVYNVALYTIKTHYEKTGKHLGYNKLYRKLYDESQYDFKELPVDLSQQVLMQVDRTYASFFKSIISYNKSKNKFKGVPRPTKYKAKNGRNIIIFTTAKFRVKGNQIVFCKKANLKPITTKQYNNKIQQVRLIPKLDHYVIEILYKKEINNNKNLDFTKYLSIDLGLNNLATVVSDQQDIVPILVSGKPIKSMNQYYNKKKAKLQSQLKTPQKTSNKIKTLTNKRNNKIKNYLHLSSKFIVQWALQHNIGNIVIGYNEGWKNEINIGKRNNQNFVQIPFLTFINQIKYKAELEGIKVILHEESYTSKCSAIDLEPIKKHDEYVGNRIKRGLFRTSNGMLINADVNGALNILRKATNDAFKPVGIGLVINPVTLKMSQTF